MEGIYFFGEHVRWNLGWNNPNQAGVFVAMWIPWLWALGAWSAKGDDDLAGRSIHRLRQNGLSLGILAAELVLWFLLCKTYSRGALLAAGAAGGLFIVLQYRRHGRFPGLGFSAMRLIAIGLTLWATEFFFRIDPRFVSQDASAGNRLALWKGGLQMIAESPWRGWGVDQSGSNFMHWFQSLDATERYAGMVNSYLHVGVERGLPLLAAVIAAALGLWLVVWGSVGELHSGSRSRRDAAAFCLMGSGCSWVAFLIANMFSTLWVFRNLWWLPAADCLIIFVAARMMWGNCSAKMVGRALRAAVALSLLLVTGLYAGGKLIPSDVRIVCDPGKSVVASLREGRNSGQVLFFPDTSVLGNDWGKEIRRLAYAGKFQDLEIFAPLADSTELSCPSPRVIVACGVRFSDGISSSGKFPDAHLILVHPVGMSVLPEGLGRRVSVILPTLDTRNSGRRWKAVCKLRNWNLSLSPGVGQDIRLVWPDTLLKTIDNGK